MSMRNLRWFFISLLLLVNPVFANPSPYIIATYPKGGTHLLGKLLNLIHGYRLANLFCHYDGYRFHPSMINEWWQVGGKPIVHLFSPEFTYNYFYIYHLDF